MLCEKMRWCFILLVLLIDVYALDPRTNDASTPDQRQFQQQMLESHNYYRRLHCFAPLKLDDALSQSALDYAQRLAKAGKLVHSRNSENYGENLFKSTSSKTIQTLDGNKVTRAWYNEINDYNFEKPVISLKTGHFTQMVWKDTKKLGVGYAISADGHTVFAVAEYVPPGNIAAEISDNVFPAKCSK